MSAPCRPTEPPSPTLPTSDIRFPAFSACRGETRFEPSAALAILDGSIGDGSGLEEGSAWDAAWIACLTNSPRWAETARCEFAMAMTRPSTTAV